MKLRKFVINVHRPFVDGAPRTNLDQIDNVLAEAPGGVEWEDVRAHVGGLLPSLIPDWDSPNEVNLTVEEMAPDKFEATQGEKIEIPAGFNAPEGVRFFRFQSPVKR